VRKKEDKWMEQQIYTDVATEIECPEKKILVIVTVMKKKNEELVFTKSHNIRTRRNSSKLL